jgi:hypothetical protein
MPAQNVVNNVNNSTTLNATTHITNVQQMDADKLARDMAAKAKASRVRMGNSPWAIGVPGCLLRVAT